MTKPRTALTGAPSRSTHSNGARSARSRALKRFQASTLLALAALIATPASGRTEIPSGKLTYGTFEAQFQADGTFSLGGEGWPPFEGSWTLKDDVLSVSTTGGPESCGSPGRYRAEDKGQTLVLTLVEDACRPRTLMMNNSEWYAKGAQREIPERAIDLTSKPGVKVPAATSSAGSWPSFRGPGASGVATKQDLPDTWSGPTGENILWKVDVPGLGHASPAVWGDRIFIASAVSSKGSATFKPGLYGDGEASSDRSEHRFELHALDRATGKTLWSKVAATTVPVDKRHIKSTYANATPATDGRIVVAAFGSQGTYAYTVEGELLWSVDVGRLNLGAYDVPGYEWGPASSPILWNGKVFLQCDTQADSFVLALDAMTGEMLWMTERDELPTWGTPTVVEGEGHEPELVTNGANLIRGYDPETGKELWRLGGSSKITAPTPIYADGVIVVTSGRAPERPIFVLKPGARGDITLPEGKSKSDDIVWSIQRRGAYMPTPIIVGDQLYVLANNGVFDAYELQTGKQLYRQRIEHGGSGFSGSPVAADGKIYIPSEDGDIFVVRAGKEYELLAKNEMDDLLMSTPAIAQGAMYVRTAGSLFAIGKK